MNRVIKVKVSAKPDDNIGELLGIFQQAIPSMAIFQGEVSGIVQYPVAVIKFEKSIEQFAIRNIEVIENE